MAAPSVESVLSAAGRPLTMAELQEALPMRQRLHEALNAAVKMGYVRRTLPLKGIPATYEYIPPEQRGKRGAR